MAKHNDRREPWHHEHALAKASASHLLKMGHIDKEQHREIVADAERGMKTAPRKSRERE